jgi:6-phosphogluconate dehydrogenase
MAKAEIGLVGLGTMGAALAANIAEKGFRIAVWNRSAAVTDRFIADAGDLAARIVPTRTRADLVAAIAPPRRIILMALLRPLLDPGDLVVDAGNADFHDTERRSAAAAAGAGSRFLGMGVSGGEDGARHGPAIMGGGDPADWAAMAPVLTAIAARYRGEPCATYMGPGGAGHFVKTVHNGIEYADMQMIAEVYGVLRDGQGLAADDIAAIFERWNRGPLQSYLVEISASVARARDPATGRPVLDVILDRAGQKGTGRWTVIEAQHLGAPVPVIEAAVAARNVSARLDERRAGEAAFGAPARRIGAGDLDDGTLERALIAGKILCYAQGFALLSTASGEFGWSLPLPGIARCWRAGCIIRSEMLNDMAAALDGDPGRNLILAPAFAERLRDCEADLRRTVAVAVLHGLPVPALAAGLAWFDQMRTGRSTANLIQAQRDFFGAHGFERSDGLPGTHGPWGHG